MDNMTILDKLGYGGGVFVFGFSVVFICLILIIGYLTIQATIFTSKKKKPVVKQDEPEAQPSNDFISQVALDDKKEIAAIAGAIAVYLGTNVGDFVIKSYRRVGSKTPAWRRAGRSDQFLNRF